MSLTRSLNCHGSHEVRSTKHCCRMKVAGQTPNTVQILDFPGQNLASAGPTVIDLNIFWLNSFSQHLFIYEIIYENISHSIADSLPRNQTVQKQLMQAAPGEISDLWTKFGERRSYVQPRDGGFSKYFCLLWRH